MNFHRVISNDYKRIIEADDVPRSLHQKAS